MPPSTAATCSPLQPAQLGRPGHQQQGRAVLAVGAVGAEQEPLGRQGDEVGQRGERGVEHHAGAGRDRPRDRAGVAAAGVGQDQARPGRGVEQLAERPRQRPGAEAGVDRDRPAARGRVAHDGRHRRVLGAEPLRDGVELQAACAARGGPLHGRRRPGAPRVDAAEGHDAPAGLPRGGEHGRVGVGELAVRPGVVGGEADGPRDAPAPQVGQQVGRREPVAVGVAAQVDVGVDGIDAPAEARHLRGEAVLEPREGGEVGAGALEGGGVLAPEPQCRSSAATALAAVAASSGALTRGARAAGGASPPRGPRPARPRRRRRPSTRGSAPRGRPRRPAWTPASSRRSRAPGG